MLRQRLLADGLSCEVCRDLPCLLAGLAGGAGAAVIAQEALAGAGVEALLSVLEGQEPWSDVPVLVLTDARSKRRPLVAGPAFERANITLLQRPLSVRLFVSSVRSAVRARRRQYQMRQLHGELAEALQLSDLFVGILGHDLRTPLQAIKLSAEVIVRASPDAGALRPAGRILASAARMERMIEQILDFARVRHGRGIPLRPVPTELGKVCRPVIQEIEDGNPTLSVHLVESGDLAGVWDADRLGQVVSNLVGNAAQQGASGRPITVEIDGTAADSVRLRIRSFGAVAPGALPDLFEAFRRPPGSADASRTRAGLGLGLFIAREIARAHGGDIAARTDDDTTTFEVLLPRRSEAPAPPA